MTWPSYWPMDIHEVASAEPQRRNVCYHPYMYVACIDSQAMDILPTKIFDSDMAKQYPRSTKKKSAWKSTSNIRTNRMVLTCRLS